MASALAPQTTPNPRIAFLAGVLLLGLIAYSFGEPKWLDSTRGQTFGIWQVCFNDGVCNDSRGAVDSDPRVPFANTAALGVFRAFAVVLLAAAALNAAVLALVGYRGRSDLAPAAFKTGLALALAQFATFVSFLVLVAGATDFGASFYYLLACAALNAWNTRFVRSSLYRPAGGAADQKTGREDIEIGAAQEL